MYAFYHEIGGRLEKTGLLSVEIDFKYCLSPSWTFAGCITHFFPHRPRTGCWQWSYTINTPALTVTHHTLLFPSMTAMRCVMLSILFPVLLVGSRMKAPPLLEQKSCLQVRRGGSHRVALWHNPVNSDRWHVGPWVSLLIKSHILQESFLIKTFLSSASKLKNSRYISQHEWKPTPGYCSISFLFWQLNIKEKCIE